jgi:hypothetical protein
MSTFPGFDNLFRIEDPLGTRAFRGAPDFGPWLALTRGEVQPSGEFMVRWGMGSAKPGDVIWTSAVFPLLVSSRVLAVLEENQISGWSTYPAKVTVRYAEVCSEYFGLSVMGRCGTRDLSRSEIVLEQYPNGWFPNFEGYFFDESSWNESDLFMEEDNRSGVIIATKKVVDAFRRARISNIRFSMLARLRESAANFEIGRQNMLPQDYQQRVNRLYNDQGLDPPKQ